jgi:hypothetical protein
LCAASADPFDHFSTPGKSLGEGVAKAVYEFERRSLPIRTKLWINTHIKKRK